MKKMKLESIFIKTFCFPFLLVLIITIILITVMLDKYTLYHSDILTSNEILKIENSFSNSLMNTVNLILLNDLLKFVSRLQQIVTYYQTIATKINTENISLSLLNYIMSFNISQNIDLESNSDIKDFYTGWFIDQYTSEKNLTNKTTNFYKQISIVSNLIQSLYTFKKSFKNIITSIYFVFEDTNLFIQHPLISGIQSGFYNRSLNLESNPSWCTDENGDIYKIYRYYCRDFYINIKKTFGDQFDYNYLNQINRTVFISGLYKEFEDDENEMFTLCVKFIDRISNKPAYFCIDMRHVNLFNLLDDINRKVRGHLLISSVGYANVFYRPRTYGNDGATTIAEYLFRSDKNFFLSEKLDFENNCQKNLTSNYIKLLDLEKIEEEPTYLFNQINPTGNEKDQYFYLNNHKIYYELFPIIVKNLNNEYEHILSIIFLYKKSDYIEHMLTFHTYNYYKIILELILFFVFGGMTLYILLLSLKTLAKYIVIPIRNIHYMIKGINLGGRNRLEYIKYLQEREEETKKQIKEINMFGSNNNPSNLDITDNEKKNIGNETEASVNNMIQNENSDKNTHIKSKNISEKTPENENDKMENYVNDVIKNEMDNKKIDDIENIRKDFDEECQNYENEINYYDFNEELLQYRPIEMNQLMNLLLNLKEAYLVSSKKNSSLESIISYSRAGEIFDDFKKNGEKSICQCNMGNLLSQLFKYDKAIYHIVSSLQGKKFKKYLSKAIKDEFDESDTLYNLIDINYNTKPRILHNHNQLVIRQQNNSSNNLQRTIIEKLINERYNKLVYVYYKFFSLLRKANNQGKLLGGIYSHKIYHTINYYHKSLIQYIYLCYVSNDLIKIGESILDYIEFIIKFKLKSNIDTRHIMEVNNFREREKQSIKKNYFDKALMWISLFDNYVEHVRSKTNLWNLKSIKDEYAKSSNINAKDSALLFKVNEQRGDFLKGKFCYVCENYGDSLFYYIRAAKKKAVVCDGLIKKRSLKNILKIAHIIQNSIKKQHIENVLLTEEAFPTSKEYDKIIKSMQSEENSSENNINEGSSYNNDFSYSNSINEIFDAHNLTFISGIKKIIKEVTKDIEECEIKQFKDILMIVDSNNCLDPEQNAMHNFLYIIKKILTECDLNNKDRLSLFFFDENHHIICPIMEKSSIDTKSIIQDLDTCIENKTFEEESVHDFTKNQRKISDNLNFEEPNEKISEFSLEGSNQEDFEHSECEENEENEDDGSNKTNDNKERINNFEYSNPEYYDSLKNSINSLNFCIKYLKMKDIDNKDRYIVFFTNIFNTRENVNGIIKTELEKLKKTKDINLIIVGRLSKKISDFLKKRLGKILNDKKNIIYSVLKNFGPKSEIIGIDNTKKIKTILSTNSFISDNIIFKNESYS